ncbi:MAG: YbgA family protein [Candidatus Methylomirabilales bacterium]
MSFPVIRVGISSCLLGNEVRYDGGHKRDRYLTDTLGRFFEWVPVCPELELGLGTPRGTLRLVGNPQAPRLVFARTQEDITGRMRAWSEARVARLERLHLCGYILKSDSPSCGMERVRVYGGSGRPAKTGTGIFARVLLEGHPMLPVEEEGRLHDLGLRENFVERVFCYRRWRSLVADGRTRGTLRAFHAAHRLLLMAHSSKHLAELDRLVAGARASGRAELEAAYGQRFMAALRIPATTRRHLAVLQHVLGCVRRDLDAGDRAEALAVLADYARGLLPLIVPLTLLHHHLRRRPVPQLAGQVYLNPHPRELMLRNHA